MRQTVTVIVAVLAVLSLAFGLFSKSPRVRRVAWLTLVILALGFALAWLLVFLTGTELTPRVP